MSASKPRYAYLFVRLNEDNLCDEEKIMYERATTKNSQTNHEELERTAHDMGPGGGLFLVVKQSIASLGSHSLPSSVITEHLTTDVEEQVFQRSYLNETLKRTDTEGLYRIYKRRVHHTLMVVYLIVCTVCNFFPVLLALLTLAKGQQYEPPSERTRFTVVPIVTRSVALVVDIVIFLLALRERFFRRETTRLVVSLLLIAVGFLAEYGATLHDFVWGREDTFHDGPTRIRNSFCFVLGVTIFLPFPKKKQAALAGLVLVLIEFGVSFRIYSSHKGRTKFVAAEFVAHLIALFVGCYVRFLMDITNKKSFLDRRNLLRTKCKINFEKEREEHLMLSIMPKCETTEKVRRDLRDRIVKLKTNQLVQRHGFNELYIQEHPNVTILYADIVNSMQLASALNPAALLETLDQLYAKFDERAEKNNCLRIKLLGDCYYCVSGIPEPQENHANNCVNMALDMIEIIRHVREQREVDVDMRIGIHTGNVLSGVLGLKRWQFDIWSIDAQIASHMEQSGKPGCVHITEKTREQLRGSYDLREGSGGDDFVKQTGLQTFFIHPSPRLSAKRSSTLSRKGNTVILSEFKKNGIELQRLDCADPNKNVIHTSDTISLSMENGTLVPAAPSTPASRNGSIFIKKQNSISARARNFIGYKRGSSLDAMTILRRRQTNILDSSMQQFQRMVKETNTMLEKEIYRMKLSKRDQWLRPDGIHPLFLTFTEKGLEGLYTKQPDPLFRYYLLCLLIVLVGMSVVHFTVISYGTAPIWSVMAYSITFLVVLSVNIAAWTGFVWVKLIKKNEELSRFPRALHMRLGNLITHSRKVRLLIWLVCSFFIIVLALMGLAIMPHSRVNTDDVLKTPTTTTSTTTAVPMAADDSIGADTEINAAPEDTILPWSYTFSIILSMTGQTVFLRIHFIYKLILNCLAIMCYVSHYDWKNSSANPLFVSDWAFMNYDDTVVYFFYLVYMLCLLHVLDRQIEYMSRVDFLSQKRLDDERTEAQIMAQSNHILLENLLPVHVAKYYLDRDSKNNNDLYHEVYKSVAVMFASIPNFIEFYRETTNCSKEGPSCLRILNEVICEFDKLLYHSKFSRVEKLKTVGSTYMAATGLEPGRGSNDSCLPVGDSRRIRSEDPRKNAKTMLRFAIAMQKALQEINQHSWQDFRLRVGISIGGVIAGVVGATKPQYDIWGDTVNMASRMDSTGEAGRIQITEEVYELIHDDQSFSVQERGEIFVKGKGLVRTYFLRSKNDWLDASTNL